ncbi:glycosyltransferase [Kosakonia sp. ML.JS2a]|uniref:TcdA/TcdB catalytic glycosyltransferase domain-containing protein n=1 Tax=Kosakonia sp. ML.JS2a TaxID=2980557 RepID=UPI0021DB5ED0|nr:TcdA/TcdB catalytic glycosyltransferase domain-containing protein [Kosakonia sp. ML.JS2a]UXY13231.1 glycosyltransferase [Kosakonia sp. ML.JS2a]
MSSLDYERSIKTMLHTAFNNGLRSCETECHDIITTLVDAKHPIPRFGHFIWVGDVNRLDTSYIKVWIETNKEMQFLLWHHNDVAFCHKFHDILFKHVKENNLDNFEDSLVNLQNEAFAFIYPRIDGDHNFNELAIEFLRMNNFIASEYGGDSSVMPLVSADDIVLMNVDDLFEGEFLSFKKLYYYEVILRGNLACASDIIRLIILYKFGGIYLDVDTLPEVDYIFSETNKFLEEISVPHNEFIIAAKAHALVEKILNKEGEVNNCLEGLFPARDDVRNALSSAISRDVEIAMANDINPLTAVFCYPDLIALSSLSFIPGTYFSNVICSCSGSRFLRIVLRVIKKRYRYLEKNNALSVCVREPSDKDYLGRLLPYRYEPIIKDGAVTLSLTGPGVIFEVLLGLFYQLFKIDESYSPDFLAKFIQNDAFGIAFFDHTLYTPLGLLSTWLD